ncbi:PREDICTED: F-box/kelch-repeat protein At3g23880-like [Prunus mume]|uniref:F-box/kelch-repeat protein At3g23880-like n=1 Tax=Prunus mume TaxID=102107 RepID=A0ABM0NKP7_PRUMU|nr:PREDICTED: F-box/kelch-repeat protein At3g23880-like [Prunus mume]
MDNIQDITQLIYTFKVEAFPQEIIHEILFRLPVKSLINCTSVCKPWRSMVMNQSFIHAHFSHTVDFANQKDIDLLLFHKISGSGSTIYCHNTVIHEVEIEVYSLHYDNKAFDVHSEIEFPIAPKKKLLNPHLRVVGTCNGLICLADDISAYGYNFFLWNPTIRKLLTLPGPGITFWTHGAYNASIGFGFDAMTNDYKVVRLVTLMDEVERPTLAEVYSLATGTWSSPACVSPTCRIEMAASNAFVNGILHWPVVSNGNHCYFILTFDLGNEVFCMIPMPKIIQWNFNLGLRLSVSDDRKSIALFMRDKGHERPHENFMINNSREDSVLDIWVMKEYGRKESWTKLITLSPQGPESHLPSALCFRKSGERFRKSGEPFRKSGEPFKFGEPFRKSGELLLLRKERWQELVVSLDLVSTQFKNLGIGYKYCTVDFYKESLLLLDKTDAESY